MSDPTTPPAHTDVTVDDGRYDIFLSYNSRDGAEVRAVRQLLLARGVRTFYDRADLNPGRVWFDELQEAIARSRAVAVFVGPSGIGTWQKREMALALDRQAGGEGERGSRLAVVPVLLPGSELGEAPGLLLLNTWLDLRRGLDDAGELDRLARAARGQAETEPPPAPALPPYRDLRVFREEDAPLFYGREVFARELLEKTKAHDLVAVVGPSGSGKSSVVQAGLLPLLRRQPPPHSGWDAVSFTPGANPFHNLALPFVSLWERSADRTSLVIKAGELGDAWAKGAPLALAVREALEASRGTTDRLLVIADQFEELFTLTPEALRRPFLEALLAASKLAEVTVLLTLRADFYGQAVGFSRELSDLMQRGQVNLGPMTRDELRLSIEEPARHVGLRFEPGLVERILEHVEEQPGSLPLLEFALTELWQKRRGDVLTNQAYDQIGEVEGAVSQRADEELKRLPEADADGLLRFLTRLVRVSAAGEEGADTRQRATLRGLDAPTAAAVESFVRARLLVKSRRTVTDGKTGQVSDDETVKVTNEQTVEVAHEALIRKWPRLRERLDKDRAFLLWRQRLRLRLDEYERTAHDPGTLLAGAPLNEALKFFRARPGDLGVAERDYIDASDRAERERRRELKRAGSRPKLVAAAVAAMLIVVALVAGLSYRAWLNSDSRRAALMREDAARQAGNSKPEVVNKWFAALALSGRVDDALAAAKAAREPNSPALALSAVASTLARGGRTDDARRAVEEAAKAAAAEDRRERLATRAAAFASIARTHLHLRQRGEARAAAAEVVNTYRQYASKFYEQTAPATGFVTSGELADLLLKTDQLDKAGPLVDDLLRVDDLLQAGIVGSDPRVSSSRLLIKLGKVEEARSLADTPFKSTESRLSFLKSLSDELKRANRVDDVKWVADKAKASADALSASGVSLRYLAEISLNAGDGAAARQPALKFYSFVSDLPAEKANDLLPETVALLAEAGMLDTALNLLHKHPEGWGNFWGYVLMVGALEGAGRREEARRLAEETAARQAEKGAGIAPNKEAQPFLRILVDGGKLELAHKLLRNGTARFDTSHTQPAVLQTASALLDEGRVAEALTLAGDLLAISPNSDNRDAIYRDVADLYIKAGRVGDFRKAVADASPSRAARSLILAALAESLFEAGESEEARSAMREALAEAAQANSSSKLLVLAWLAQAQARLGLLREGEEAVKDCPPDDKLEFYSIAVLKYAGLDDNRLLKALEPDSAEVRRDRDE